MAGFLWSQLRRRRSRAAALGTAILVTALAFTLLTASVSHSALRVQGTVTEHFSPAYDILVRPPGSFSEIEEEHGLVQANYLSGIFGGISFEEYERIKEMPGVEVAAPVANIGYVLNFAVVDVNLDRYLNEDPVQLYRVRAKFAAHGGTSQYAGRDNYVYVTRVGRFTETSSRGLAEIVPGRKEPVNVCGYAGWGGRRYGWHWEGDVQARGTNPGPWWGRGAGNLNCYSTLTPGRFGFQGPWADSDGRSVLTGTDLNFPFLLAAIDPEAENRLLNLDETIVAGRGLQPGEGATIHDDCVGTCEIFPDLPTIASVRTYADTELEFEIERLRIPAGTNVPVRLEANDSQRWAASLEGELIGRQRVDTTSMYERLLERRGLVYGSSEEANLLGATQYWTHGPVRYERLGPLKLRATPTANPWEVWRTPLHGYAGGYRPAPPGNEDVQFRRLRNHPPIATAQQQGGGVAQLRLVGRFDPERLPGFSPLSEVPLESYYPPEAHPVDEASRRALGGRPLRPTMNLGDYVAQPPFLLTTLEAAKAMVRTLIFEGANEQRPISVIRVRVEGAVGPDPVSQERIRLVAERIQRETGLDVDVTAGSSPRQVAIELPSGKFGRPALLVREGWVKKGVAVAIVGAVDRKSAGLLALVVAASVFFLANGALAGVRTRRAEIGTLATLGWPRRAIFAAILGELALVAVAAGLLATALGFALISLLGLELALWRLLMVLPVALALALLAGLVPAWAASRVLPLEALNPPVVAGARARRVRRLVSLAAVNLLRLPLRALVAASGLVVGVGALTVLVSVQRAFQGEVVGTLLGNAIAVQVRTADLVAAGLVLALATLAVADVLYLNLRERAAEFATLRAAGWRGRDLAAVVGLEGIALGLAGSLAGALAGSALALWSLGVPAGPLLVAAGIGVAAGATAALVASLAPLLQLTRLTMPTVLAEE